MNDLGLCLEVVSKSQQPLLYIWRWSRKPLEIEAWFQRTTNRKPMTDDVKWPWKVKLVIPIRLECNISKTAVFRPTPFQRTINRKWHLSFMDYQMVTWPVTDDVMWFLKVLWGTIYGRLWLLVLYLLSWNRKLWIRYCIMWEACLRTVVLKVSSKLAEPLRGFGAVGSNIIALLPLHWTSAAGLYKYLYRTSLLYAMLELT